MIPESQSSVYWRKLSTAKKFAEVNRIPKKEVLHIEKSKYTYSTKILMLEHLEKIYKITF